MIPDHPNRMGGLTSEERRRIFLAKRETAGPMLARFRPAPRPTGDGAPRRGRLRVLTAAMIVMLLGGGFAASQPVELHLPPSIVETLMPRVE